MELAIPLLAFIAAILFPFESINSIFLYVCFSTLSTASFKNPLSSLYGITIVTFIF